MIIYVTFGGMKATTWVQIIKACLLFLAGATFIAFAVMVKFSFSFEACSPRRSRWASEAFGTSMAPARFGLPHPD